jgi:cell division protein FtsN
LAQDDYFYEIQLTNKQLVFYFMAGATGLILSFLAGVMVGRGVDGSAAEPATVRVPTEERVVAEETPRPAPSAEDLTYAQRLESDKADDSLQKPVAGSPSPRVVPRPLAAAESPRPIAPSTAPRAAPTPTPKAAATVAPPPRPSPTPRPSPSTRMAAASPPPAVLGGGNFTIQVGAFKDRASADSVMARLKGKGFAAYVTSPQGEGLFNVRVGNYTDRADAERVAGRLRDDEKFKPFIVRN